MIKIQEEIRKYIPGWNPADIAFIKSLEIISDKQDEVLNITAVFLSQSKTGTDSWPDSRGEFYELCIHFQEVSFLKLEMSGPLSQIIRFEIIDLNDRGYQDSRYQIADYEDGRINFYCKNILLGITPPRLVQ